MRGLKQLPEYLGGGLSTVAPFTGAWIETPIMTNRGDGGMSHPLRVRGLKHFGKAGINEDSAVAPFTGAWIETQLVVFLCQLPQRRTLYGCDHQASVTL